jgi:hypothetical protein
MVYWRLVVVVSVFLLELLLAQRLLVHLLVVFGPLLVYLFFY